MATATISARPDAPAIEPAVATSRLGHVLVFVVLSVGLAAVATLGGVPSALVPFVLALVPTAFALTLAWREGPGEVRRLLAMAVTRPNRRGWYVLVALPIVWSLAVVGAAVALGAPGAGLFDRVFPAILIIPIVVLIPAFAEELAWRGYAVTRLLPSTSPLAAALLLGIPWAVIHLFLQLPGQMNAGLDWWPTIVSLIGYSVILTWAFVGSGGSILLVALIHAGLNGVAPVMAGVDIDRAWAIRAVLVAAIALAIVVMGGFRGLSARSLDTHARALRP
jgi:membrane protease YdiL (CAAX protease family)